MVLTFALLLFAQVGEPSIDKLLGDSPAATAPAPATTPAPMPPTSTRSPMDPVATTAPAATTNDAAKAAPAPAANNDSPPGDSKAASQGNWLSDMFNSGAMGYMIAGGIFMWPILILG